MSKTSSFSYRLLLWALRYTPFDKAYLRLMFKHEMGYKLNLRNPKNFHEKLQWLKLYNRKPIYTTMVDKYAVKEYVAKLVGPQYVIPSLGVWNRPEEIDWEKLPNQFVLKTTDGGGSTGVIICKDKSTFNTSEAINKLNESMRLDIYRRFREWPYKNVPKRILAEEYMQDPTSSVGGDLNDYKFYCFNGEVTYCEVISGRRTKKAIDFFDLNWNHVDFCFNTYDYYEGNLEKPSCFDEMVAVAGKLCKDLPYSRIDLYEVGGKVYFGEITFFPASGFLGYHPHEWNRKLGDMIDLSKMK